MRRFILSNSIAIENVPTGLCARIAFQPDSKLDATVAPDGRTAMRRRYADTEKN